jgi:hypothetical protein
MFHPLQPAAGAMNPVPVTARIPEFLADISAIRVEVQEIRGAKNK